MTTIEVFDPALCCSTGVCGPSVDPALSQFAGDAEWLATQGVSVQRYNLAQQPGAFAEREIVREALNAKGEDCLPLILADGKVVSEGSYPDREQLAALAGLETPVFIYTALVDELVAVAAAIASNCEPCLDYHVDLALKLGLSRTDIARAVKTAKKVKETPARHIANHADELLSDATSEAATAAPPDESAGCGCSSDESSQTTAPAGKASGCC